MQRKKKNSNKTKSSEGDSSSAILSQDSGVGNDKSGQELENDLNGLTDEKELCITCNINPKDGIFLHGQVGHMCCCYKCSIRTWKTNKRCPMCNSKIKNVVKVFK